MTTEDDKTHCDKCWCPTHLGHNTGCPNHPDSKPTDQAEWDQGWRYGFDDNDLPPGSGRSKAFIFGHRAGKNQIDILVDDAAQSRCFG